jgi:hypothetical protein
MDAVDADDISRGHVRVCVRLNMTWNDAKRFAADHEITEYLVLQHMNTS